jgi:hypothetical protein
MRVNPAAGLELAQREPRMNRADVAAYERGPAQAAGTAGERSRGGEFGVARSLDVEQTTVIVHRHDPKPVADRLSITAERRSR